MKRVMGISAAALTVFLTAACEEGGRRAVAVPEKGTAAQHEQEPARPHYAGLIEEYRQVLAEDPENLAGLIALGNAYYDSGRWKEAVAVYEKVLAVSPRNADVRTDMGTAYRNLGRYDRALAAYRTALVHDPLHANARYNMGVVYAYDLKDYAAAVSIWEELLRTAPTHPQAQSMKSCIIKFKEVMKGEEQ